MQNETSSTLLPGIQENVLLKCSSVAKITTAKNIVSDAQRRAKSMIKAADREADSIRTGSYLAGYERGLLIAVDAIASFMADSHRHAHDLYLQLQEDTRALLLNVLNDDEVILKVIDNWVDEVEKSDIASPFHFLMPQSCRRLKPEVTKLIDFKHAGGVSFEYHHESRFVFKYKEKLAEFYPEEFVNMHATELLSKKDLYTDCQKISAEAVHNLECQISRYLPVDNAKNDASENSLSEDIYDDD